MRDTYRRYCAVKKAIMHCYQPRPTGHRATHLHTLVTLMRGLTRGNHAHLSSIADHAPSNGATQERSIKGFRRRLARETPPAFSNTASSKHQFKTTY